MTPQKFGLFLVAMCMAALAGFYLAVRPAHAANGSAALPTKRDEAKPTERDYQRLNACASAIMTYGESPEKDQEARTVTCAAYGKAVSHIESAKGNSYYAINRRNLYGIRRWDKAGRPHIKTYKTYMEGHLDYARIYFLYYEGLSNKRKATKYTGEAHAIKHYTAHLNRWVPIYRELYQSITN